MSTPDVNNPESVKEYVEELTRTHGTKAVYHATMSKINISEGMRKEGQEQGTIGPHLLDGIEKYLKANGEAGVEAFTQSTKNWETQPAAKKDHNAYANLPGQQEAHGTTDSPYVAGVAILGTSLASSGVQDANAYVRCKVDDAKGNEGVQIVELKGVQYESSQAMLEEGMKIAGEVCAPPNVPNQPRQNSDGHKR